MKFAALSALLFMSCAVVSGQNLIGCRENEVMKYMKENRKDMNIDKVINSSYIYLKYTDSADSQTMLFFLNADSVCQSIRIICDESSKERNIKEFDSKYRKNGEYSWIDTRKGKNYRISLKDETWSSIITIEPIK